MANHMKESFLGGALVLTVSNIVSRLLGALYRIPLYPILGKEGVGLFSMAYPLYALILTVSTAGVNVAVSKLVAEHQAKGDSPGAEKVFSSALWLLGVSGFVFSVALFGGSQFVAEKVTKDPRSALSIAAIAPAIFFVSVMSAYRGYFQGLLRMGPTAISQVIEQVVRVATMFVLALLLLPRGLEYAAAGATFGAVTGALIGLIYLMWVYFRLGARTKSNRNLQNLPGESTRGVIGRILGIAIPISLTSGILSLIQMVDVIVVPGRLQALGLGYAEATAQFGQLSGGAIPIMNLPTVFTTALQVSLVPAITESVALGNWASVKSRTFTALRLTFMVMIPAAVGLYILSSEIPAFLYGDPGVGPSLAALASAALFLSLQQTSSGVLQGLGFLHIPVKTLLLGAVAKVVATYVLTSMPAFGIKGAAYGTVLAFLVSSALNLTALSTRVGSVFSLPEMLIKPLIAVAGMGVATRFTYNSVYRIMPRVSVATLLAVSVGMLVYGLILLVSGGLRESDFNIIPKVGPGLAGALKKTGLLRK